MPEKGAKGAKAPKPKRASLPKTLFSESTLTLDQALQLLGLPRQVGLHPDDGKPIVANFGPYSPYVKHNTDFRSLDSEAAVFEVTLDQAVELFRQPKQSRRQSVSRTVLNALGPRPGTEKAMQVLSGRYGPYVTDGTTHASLPKSADPATITIAEAEELLKAREAMGPPQKKGAPQERRARRPAAESRRRLASEPRSAPCRIGSRRPDRRGGAGRQRSGVAGRLARRPRRPARDAAGEADRRAQDRRLRRAGVQQLVPRRQAR